MNFMFTGGPRPCTTYEVQAKLNRDRPGPDAASSRLEAGKVWGLRPGPNPEKGSGRGRQPGARRAAPSTAYEASGVYVGRPKN